MRGHPVRVKYMGRPQFGRPSFFQLNERTVPPRPHLRGGRLPPGNIRREGKLQNNYLPRKR
jgi:hypothetical protein